MEATIEIKNIDEALAWGDDWERAYREAQRGWFREIHKLQDRVFELEHALKAEQFERALDEQKHYTAKSG